MNHLGNFVKDAIARLTPNAFTSATASRPEQLDVREAYRLWAPSYSSETAVSALDEELAHQMLHGIPYTRLLDAGCGIGRRIENIPEATGIDLCPEMLIEGGAHNAIIGDIRQMPFDPDCFDMIWCRLVLGHLPDPIRAYSEFARVCKPGGYIFVTDFHPDAVAAGHRRTMTGPDGKVHDIEHHVHTNHVRLAMQAGLSLILYDEGVVGPSVQSFYLRGIGPKAYHRDLGLKLLSAFLFWKPNAPVPSTT